MKFYVIDPIQDRLDKTNDTMNNARKDLSKLDNVCKAMNNNITTLQTQMTYGVILDASPKGKLELKRQHDTESHDSSIISQSHQLPNKFVEQTTKLTDEVVDAKVNAAIDQDIEEILGNVQEHQLVQTTQNIIKRIKDTKNPCQMMSGNDDFIDCCDEDNLPRQIGGDAKNVHNYPVVQNDEIDDDDDEIIECDESSNENNNSDIDEVKDTGKDKEINDNADSADNIDGDDDDVDDNVDGDEADDDGDEADDDGDEADDDGDEADDDGDEADDDDDEADDDDDDIDIDIDIDDENEAEIEANVVNEAAAMVVNKIGGKVVNETGGKVVNEVEAMVANETVGKSVNETVGKSVNETVGKSVNETVGEVVNETVGEVVNETVGEVVNETVGEVVNEVEAMVDRDIIEDEDEDEVLNNDQIIDKIVNVAENGTTCENNPVTEEQIVNNNQESNIDTIFAQDTCDAIDIDIDIDSENKIKDAPTEVVEKTSLTKDNEFTSVRIDDYDVIIEGGNVVIDNIPEQIITIKNVHEKNQSTNDSSINANLTDNKIIVNHDGVIKTKSQLKKKITLNFRK